jgi:hypothetical protein
MTSKSTTPPAAIDAGIALMRLSGIADAGNDLSRLASERDLLENRIRAQVHTVIRLGGSWTTVSAALGVSKQAAWERYKIVPPKYAHPLDAKP